MIVVGQVISYKFILYQYLNIYKQHTQMNPFPKAPQAPTSQEEQLMQLLQSNPQLMQKYQQQLSRVQAHAKTINPPMTNAEYLEKLPNIEKYLDSEGGLTIVPTPAFVIKFIQKRTNEKIFVNVVTHQVIDHPEQKDLVDFDNQPGLRIPMSMGKIREDNDKSGNVCKVVDVVLNPMIVQTAQTSNDILSFTAQIIGNYLLEKYKIAVADDVLKKIKGLKYKGNQVEIQRVKAKKAPKIEKISEQQAKIKQMQQQKEQQLLNQINDQTLKNNIMRPVFQIFAYTDQNRYQPYSLDVKQYSKFKIVIDLPHLIHSKGIHLEGSARLIYLSVKNMYELCLKLPFDAKNYTTKFSRKQRKLQIQVFKIDSKQVQELNTKQSKISDQQNGNRSQNRTKIEIENDLLYDLV